MQLHGEQIIFSSRADVWAALNDPDVLARCIEGCERLERLEDGRLAGVVQAKVGPVRAAFKGEVTISDVVEGERYRLSGEGKGGVAGFAKGAADVSLTDAEGGTLMRYTVDVTVGGKLAQLGARLIDATAQAYAQSFFERLRSEIEAPGGAPEAGADMTQAATDTSSTGAADASASGLSPWLWGGALVALGLLLLWLLA